MRLLLLFLLLLSILLVVLIIGNIVLVTAVCSVRVSSVVLGILRTVVSCAGSSASAGTGCGCCRGGLSGWAFRGWRVLLLVMVVVAAIATTGVSTLCTLSTMPTMVTISSLTVATTVVVLGRVFLEPLVLFTDVGEQVIAELFCGFHIVGVRSTVDS